MPKFLLLEDTRQQISKHATKHRWFLEHDISWSRETLSCGDYQLAGKGDIAVDTKKDIQELIGDIQVKTISKRAVTTAVDNLLNPQLREKHAANLVKLITGDDVNKDINHEISKYVYENNLDEALISRFQSLYTEFRGFFHRGLVRAQIRGVKLYILVASDPEHIGHNKTMFSPAVTCVKDLFKWVNPRRLIVKAWTKRDMYGNRKPIYKYPTAMKGETLAKALISMENKYGCTFVFCKNAEMGSKIIELLTGEKI